MEENSKENLFLYPGEVKQLCVALIIMSLTLIFSIQGGIWGNVFFVFCMLFATRMLNKRDAIAYRCWGKIILYYFIALLVASYGTSLLLVILGNMLFQVIGFVIFTLLVAYGWIAYYKITKSETLIAKPIDTTSSTVETSGGSVGVINEDVTGDGETKINYCTMCGNKIADNARFCACCGNEIVRS